MSLPEDPEYRDIWKLAMHGSYTPPDRQTVLSHVVLLGAEGKLKLFAQHHRITIAYHGIPPLL